MRTKVLSLSSISCPISGRTKNGMVDSIVTNVFPNSAHSVKDASGGSNLYLICNCRTFELDKTDGSFSINEPKLRKMELWLARLMLGELKSTVEIETLCSNLLVANEYFLPAAPGNSVSDCIHTNLVRKVLANNLDDVSETIQCNTTPLVNAILNDYPSELHENVRMACGVFSEHAIAGGAQLKEAFKTR